MIERFRKFENLHILFWLVKDMCWLMEWKIVGLVMIAPTLSVAIWLTLKFRKTWSELSHNLAITLWISANSWWMINEFFLDDRYKSTSLYPFIMGLAILAYFYLPAWTKSVIAKT